MSNIAIGIISYRGALGHLPPAACDHPIISIYPELILYVEPDVLNLKLPSYGTIYPKISKTSVIFAPSKNN